MHVFKTRPNSALALLAFRVTYFPTRTDLKYKQRTVLDKCGHGCGRFNETKANRKAINLLNKKWDYKNPPQTTQLNKKMKKEEIGNAVNNNNPQAGERGGEGKNFAQDLTELTTRERRKNY